MRNLFFILALFPFLSFSQNKVIVIRHVAVIDVVNERVNKDLTIVITGKRITSISRNVSIPNSATIIDAGGKYLIPGLWDMHVHSLRQERIPLYFPLFVANGITGIRDMSTPLGDFDLYKADMAKNKIAVRPHIIIACGPAIDGQNNARPGLSIPVATAEQAKEAVDTLSKHGVDFIKVYSLLGREAFFAIMDEAKKKGLTVTGHVPVYVSALEASDAKLKSMEHSYGILESCSRNEAAIR